MSYNRIRKCSKCWISLRHPTKTCLRCTSKWLQRAPPSRQLLWTLEKTICFHLFLCTTGSRTSINLMLKPFSSLFTTNKALFNSILQPMSSKSTTGCSTRSTKLGLWRLIIKTPHNLGPINRKLNLNNLMHSKSRQGMCTLIMTRTGSSENVRRELTSRGMSLRTISILVCLIM